MACVRDRQEALKAGRGKWRQDRGITVKELCVHFGYSRARYYQGQKENRRRMEQADGRFSVDDGRWTVDDGRWTMNGHGHGWTMDDGPAPLVLRTFGPSVSDSGCEKGWLDNTLEMVGVWTMEPPPTRSWGRIVVSLPQETTPKAYRSAWPQLEIVMKMHKPNGLMAYSSKNTAWGDG